MQRYKHTHHAYKSAKKHPFTNIVVSILQSPLCKYVSYYRKTYFFLSFS